MPTYAFSCPCGWSQDKRVGIEVTSVPCPSCGATAGKESVYRINFGGFASTPPGERDYRQLFKDSQEAGAEIEYAHERLKDATQLADLKPPPLYKMAKAKAKALTNKGVTVDDLP